jgi:tRNA (cmo5U34)-methyltransferase
MIDMSNIEIFENERATGYNEFVETWIPNYNFFLDRLPRLVRETANKDLLVVGCGTGNEIARFVDAPEDWQITGVDPSPEMVNQAREKLQSYANVTLIDGVVADLDPKRTYGAATLVLVLHFLKDNGDKLSLLRAIAERLEPGAPFIVLDITGDEKQIQANLKVLKHFLHEGLDEHEIENRLTRIDNELHHVSEERFAELCVEAGFETPLRFFQSTIYMGWLMRRSSRKSV